MSRGGFKADIKGAGDWVVYFETGFTLHRWHHSTKVEAIKQAVKLAKKIGLWIVVREGGLNSVEIRPSGKARQWADKTGWGEYK